MSDKALNPATLELTQKIQLHFPRELDPVVLRAWNGAPAEVISACLLETFGMPPAAKSVNGDKYAAAKRVIDLGDGRKFTVEETVELGVDYGITPSELGRRAEMDSDDWEYVAKPPAGQRKVKAVIGRLNRNWTEEQVTDLLAKPGCPLKGSGAWVREGYLAARPKYDGKGSIAFPDAETSRWQNVRLGGVYFPRLWSGSRRWRRDLGRVGSGWSASSRLCLLCE